MNSEEATFRDGKESKRAKRTRRQGIRSNSMALEDDQARLPSRSSSMGVAKPVRRDNLTGRLANMMFMPIDIFCEVAYHLGPDDLLRLSRSSKALREILISKSRKSIWQRAEKSYGLPECPQDLSSPQYASFIFDLFCSLCMNMRKFKYYVIYRLRLCNYCASASILSGHKLPQQNDMTQMTDDEREDIYSLVPRMLPGRLSLRSNTAASKYYVSAFKEAYEQYISISSSSERRNFVCERREIVQKIASSASAMEDWIKQNRSEDEYGHSCCYSVQASRRDSIYKKLRESGYSDRDFVTYDDEENWRWKNLIVQNRELTEWIWDTIRPQLEETIRLRRAKKLPAVVKQRCDKLMRMTKEFNSNPNNYCLLTAQDLFQLPTAKQIIENDDPNVDFDDTTWLTIKSEIAERSGIWKHDIEVQIVSRILEGRHQAREYCPEWETDEEQCSVNAAICQHATSFFVVNSGARPEVIVLDQLFHWIRYEFEETLNDYTAPFEWTLKSRAGIFSPATVLALYRSLEITGSTMSDMAKMKDSFVCLCCDPILRTSMSWIELVQHFYHENLDFGKREVHHNEFPGCIQPVNYHDASVSVQLAAYTGVSNLSSESSLERWITTCRCEECKKFKHAFLSCGECRALGARYTNFICQKRLDAHVRQAHPKRSEES